MMRCVALAALTTAGMAMQAEPSFMALQTGRRQLQRTGAVESNVCGHRAASTGGDRLTNTCDATGRVGGSGTPCRNGHTALEGTMHDDVSDHQVDCTTGVYDANAGTCFEPDGVTHCLCDGGQGNAAGYNDNLDCTKTMVAPAGHTVSLVFTSMNLENNADFVTVYDGADDTATMLGRFTGSDLPNVLSSTGPEMTVNFHTDTGNWGLNDGNGQDPGFYADWHFVNVLADTMGICAAPAQYTDPHGIIHDEETGHVNCAANAQQWGNSAACNSGAGYADGTACYTTILAPAGQQVRLTFTQMNLELIGCSAGQSNGGCPDGGCDFVQVHDGITANDPIVGRYSGSLVGADLPSIVSSGTGMYVVFRSDTGNCGITGSEDPGFYAEWDFIENGQDICSPSSAVLHDTYGVIRDDDPSNDGITGTGYLDNADCGVRIRGAAHSTVNFHLVQMNLEGMGNGIGDTTCAPNGCDFLDIYDGRNANAPLLAHWTGQPTDQVLGGDTVTSTGRDMYLHFTSDAGNYGLTGTTGTPGFYGEWNIITDGQTCETFQSLPGTAIAGHNSETITGTVAECEAACCARSWCKSFDYIQSTTYQGQTLDAGANDGTCNLADVNAITQQGATVRNPYNTLYEKPVDAYATAPAGPIGNAGCAAMLSSISTAVNHLCCPAGGCAAGVPRRCSEECSGVWMPFARQCSEYIKTNEYQMPEFTTITAKCELTEFGKYHSTNTAHGRCSDSDLQTYFEEFAPACCGGNAQYCPGLNPADSSTLVTPTNNGAVYCLPECATYVEEFNSECHVRTDGTANGRLLDAFIGVCQGITVPPPPPVSGCLDDPTGAVAGAGVTCSALMVMMQSNCASDLHILSDLIPVGTPLSSACPLTCGTCQGGGHRRMEIVAGLDLVSV